MRTARRLASHPIRGRGRPRLAVIFRKDPFHAAAAQLYGAAVVQARQPAFYAEGGVPDTLDGRFEMLALHVFLIMHRLKDAGEAAALSRRLVEALFDDLDAN